MAYPDYSIVIVSITENGVTTDYANAFYNEQLAKKFYEKSAREGKRVFYFEKPTPSKFSRNDAQPLKINSESGQENVSIESLDDGQEQGTGEVFEEIKLNIEYEVEDAYKTAVMVRRIEVKVATKYFDTFYVGPFKFFKKTFNRTVYESVGVIGVNTISNKRVTFIHNGNGGFTCQVEKLWPDRDEVIDEISETLNFEIEGQQVPVGTRFIRKTYGGNGPQDFVQEYVSSYYNEGTAILETETSTYRSNGTGWYSVFEKTNENPPPCPNIGQIAFESFVTDLTFPIEKDDNSVEFVHIGGKYDVGVVSENCDIVSSMEDRWRISGTKVSEDDTYNYFSDGNGGTTKELKPVDDNGGDNNGDNNGDTEYPPYPCVSEGTYIRTEILVRDADFRPYGAGLPNMSNLGTYRASTTTLDWVADGNCGEKPDDEKLIWTPAGTWIATHAGTGPYYADANIEFYTLANGDYSWRIRKKEVDDDDVLNEDGNPVDPPVPDNPEPPSKPTPPIEPIPPTPPEPEACHTKTEYPYSSDSDFKTKGGAIVSSGSVVVERSAVLTNGFYWSRSTSDNTRKFITGKQWKGRQLHAGGERGSDGNCQFYNEPEGGLGSLTYPAGTAKDVGYFSAKSTVVQYPYEWPINWTDGKLVNGVYVWKTARCTVYHDGKQNVKVTAWIGN